MIIIDRKPIDFKPIRRFSYLKYIVSVLSKKSLSPIELRDSILEWAYTTKEDYLNYIDSTQFLRNPTVARSYISIAAKLDLIVQGGRKLGLTRQGRLLDLLQEDPINVYSIKGKELMFFTYLLFEKDTDLILLALESFIGNPTGSQIKLMKDYFTNNYLAKLDLKLNINDSNKVRTNLRKIQHHVEKFGIQEQHIIPRIHLLIDLNFLKKEYGKKGIYRTTDIGSQVINRLPILSCLETGASRDFVDIDNNWLEESMFKTIAPLVSSDTMFYEREYTNWDNRSNHIKFDILCDLLPKMFDHFRISKSIQKVWLNTSWLYFCIRSTIDHYTPIDYDDFCSAMKQCPIIDNYKYEIRKNETINESYLLRNYL